MSGDRRGVGVRPGFGRTLRGGFDTALEQAQSALVEQGFAVLTRVDVHEKFAEKLGIEYPRTVILGACNPRIAHSALMAEPDVALMMPCSVVVRDEGGGATRVEVADPRLMVAIFPDAEPELGAIAAEAARSLERALESL